MLALVRRRAPSPKWLVIGVGIILLAAVASGGRTEAVIECIDHCIDVAVNYPKGVPHPH